MKLRKTDIRAYRNIEGAWVVFALVNNVIEKHRYYYFTKREAIDDFYHRVNG